MTTTFVYAHMRKNADLRVVFSRFRLYSTVSSRASPNSPRLNPKDRELTPDEQEEKDAEFRKRKTEWKRRQGGETFLDHLIMHVRAGMRARGRWLCRLPPREVSSHTVLPLAATAGAAATSTSSPDPHLTTLSSVSSHVRGNAGCQGMGTWQHGRAGAPVVLRVPLGTVVRELTRGDPRRTQDEWEAEEEAYEQLDKDERRQRWRERRWVHYPMYEDDNTGRSAFKQAEWDLWRAEREMRGARRQRDAAPLALDLDHLPPDAARAPDAPLGLPRVRQLGTLVASGGAPGYGNPHFHSTTNPSPKFATRGYEGERVTLELELKLLADVGLVGAPNAGKSTLLRALTGGRARSSVAEYAFTTLNPVVGVVRVAEDGSFVGGEDGAVYDETNVERQRERELMESGATPRDIQVTVADNPGLIEDASDNVGLGHSFLRSMERSLALVYVVDLSGPAPWDELRMLQEELEKYKPGMSARARMVIANKADLLGGDGDQEEVRLARAKLVRLEEFVRTDMGNDDRALDVVPTSAKYSQNLRSIVHKLQTYVEEARLASSRTQSPIPAFNIQQL
ncbi:P-loop containing nucleoside triphosphate hydrolase protein [Lactarius hengduanensis]|nr:P-loop containing nucleoside triphosphate hydrolase protein [Lactarius hengduanensis]